MKPNRHFPFFLVGAFLAFGPFLYATQDDHLPDFLIAEISDVTPPPHEEYYYEKGETIEFEVVVRNANYQAGDVYRNVSLWFSFNGFGAMHQEHFSIPELRDEVRHRFQVNTAANDVRVGMNNATASVNLSRLIPEIANDLSNQMNLARRVPVVEPGRLPDLDYGQNRPDLEITGIRNVTQGVAAPYALSDRLQFEVTIRNNNFAQAPRVRNFWVGFDLGQDWIPNSSIRIDEMNQQEMSGRAELFLASATLGEKRLAARVDGARSIPETNENNNQRTFDDVISITQAERPLNERPTLDSDLPDFVVTGIANVTPGEGPRYVRGTILEFDVSVRNNNYARSGAQRGVEVRLNFQGEGFIEYIQTLQESAVVHYRILTDQHPGLQANPLTATIDASSNVEEVYEDNNGFRSNLTLEVYSEPPYRSPRPDDFWDHQPDLTVTAVRNVTPGFQAPTEKGAVLEFEATIQNLSFQPGDILRRVPVHAHFGWDLGIGLSLDRMEREGTVRFVVDTGTQDIRLGEKRLRVAVDEQNGIRETNDRNNEFELPDRLNIVARQRPAGTKDLVLETARFDPPNARRGDVVHALYRVSNQGTDPTGLFYVTARLSNNREVADLIENLNPGQVLERPIPAEVRAGFGGVTDGMVVTADLGGYVPESNENNNAQSFQVNYPFPNQNVQDRARQTVDLVVHSIRRAVPENVSAGGVYELNQNDASHWEVRVFDNDFVPLAQEQRIENIQVNLEAGNARVLQSGTMVNGQALVVIEIPGGQIGVGDTRARATVDPQNRVQESNENNNAADDQTPLAVVPQGAYEPTPQPDLVMESVSFDPPNPRRGDRVTPVFHLHNTGNKRSGPFYVMFYKDASDWAGYLVENMAPGQMIEGRSSATFLAGTQRIRAKADPYSYIFETNEENNEASLQLDLASPNANQRNQAPVKDLYIASIQKRPRNVVNLWGEYELNQPEEIELAVLVLDNDHVNNGIVQRVENVEVVLHAGAWSQSQNITLTSGQGEAIYNISGATLGQGTHALSAEVDPRRRIQESNEGNNSYESRTSIAVLDSGALVPTPFSDLIISHFSVDPENPRVGDRIIPVLELTNQGDADSGVFNVKVVNPNIILGPDVNGHAQYMEYLKQVQSLAPGEHRAVRFEGYQISPRRDGDYRLTAEVDYDERVIEYDNRNNFGSVRVNVLPRAGFDLQLASFQLQHGFEGRPIESAHVGERVRYSVLVRNNGAEAIPGYSVKLWPTANAQPLVLRRDRSLVFDGFAVHYFDDVRYAAEGAQTARAVLDPDNQINEFDENNNQAEIPIRILPAQAPPQNAGRPVITTPVYAWDRAVRGTFDRNFDQLSDHFPSLKLYHFDRAGRLDPAPSTGGSIMPAAGTFELSPPFLQEGARLFVIHQERDPQTREILSVESETVPVLPRNDYTPPRIQEPLREGARVVQGTCDNRWQNAQISIHFMQQNGEPEFDARGRSACGHGRFRTDLTLDLWQDDRVVAKFNGINNQGINISNGLSQTVTVGAPNGRAADRRLPVAADFDPPRIVGPLAGWQWEFEIETDPDFNRLSDHMPGFSFYYLDENQNRRALSTNGVACSDHSCRVSGVNLYLRPGREIFVVQHEQIPRTNEILSIESPHERVQARADYHSVALQGPLSHGAQRVEGTYDATARGGWVRIYTVGDDGYRQAGPLGENRNPQGGNFRIDLNRELLTGEKVVAVFAGTSSGGTYIAEDQSAPVIVRPLALQLNAQQPAAVKKIVPPADAAKKIQADPPAAEKKPPVVPEPAPKKKKAKAGFFKRLFVDDPADEKGGKFPEWSPQEQAKRSKAEEQALDLIESRVPKAFIEELAKHALKNLFEAYSRKDLHGFMELVSNEFISDDGKRPVDLQSSLITDFEELFTPVLTLRSINQVNTRDYKSWLVTIAADWNRNAEVEINFQRQRWQFEGRSEFTFHVDLEGALNPLALKDPKQADYRSLRWKAWLHQLRGDKIFGLTDLQGVLRVEASTGGRRSTLDGQRVTTAVFVGRTGQGRIQAGGTLLQNQTATISSGSVSTQSIDFSSGSITTTPIPGTVTQGDVFINSSGDFEAVGSASITSLPGVDSGNFDAYTKDTEPFSTTAAFSSGDAFLVRTQQGKYAKFLVTNKAGSLSLVTADLKYAFQPDGTGNLTSQD